MKIKKIWFEKNRIYTLADDGRTLWQSLLYYPRLRFATQERRAPYEMNAFGVRWETHDEDISFDSFDYDNPESHGISRVRLSHPELNMSALDTISWHSAKPHGSLLQWHKKTIKRESPSSYKEHVPSGKESLAFRV